MLADVALERRPSYFAQISYVRRDDDQFTRDAALLPDRVSPPRTVFHFLARTNTFSCSRSSSICAATVNPANGICERQIQEHKNKGSQDRLPPVLGAMCNARPPDNHGRGLSTLALANKHSRVDQDAVAYSGNVIDQISENMANCIRGHQNSSPSAAELRG
jgi:hypothetical protein